MADHHQVETGCSFVGEFIEQGEVPTDLKYGHGEVERPRVIGSYLDVWCKDELLKEFTVLLKNKQVVTVRGHGLKFIPNPSNPTSSGSFGILEHAPDGEVLTAVFPVDEVSGIFHGKMRVSADSA